MSQQIEGLPPGTRISRVKLGNPADTGFMGFIGIEPDNVYFVTDLKSLKIPEGFDGFNNLVFDTPSDDEWWLGESGQAYHGRIDPNAPDTRRLILRKVKRTKRVLVAEWDGFSVDIFADKNKIAFDGIVPPVRHSIEEREEPQFTSHMFVDDCDIERPRAEEGPHAAAEPTLHEFRMFCEAHPDLRFWQALQVWSGAVIISYGQAGQTQDTFHWKGRNEWATR